jgi:hypothetical protein
MDYTMWDSLSAGRTEKFTEQNPGEVGRNISVYKQKLRSPLEHGRRDCGLCVVRMVAILIIC